VEQVSLHHEWTLSLRLRPDTPGSFLDELRFHLGLTDHAPEVPELEYDLSLHPWLNFYVQDGRAYAAEPGGGVEPLDESGPPFTLSRTSDVAPGQT
jgi:hypothetical protein